VLLLCTSILSLESVVAAFPLTRLRRSTLVVDVLSVKVFPKNLFLARLPPSCDILCLHPMFGPESGKASWAGLPLVYDRVRVGAGEERARRCDALLAAFEREGCRMVEMACEEHDKLAASSQFITHTVGRMLGGMALPDTQINTKGYASLLSLVENTSRDSFDLYYGLFMYNENATEELARLEAAFDTVKRQLFDQLNDVVRKRLLSGGKENE
jgi:arogenate dehydrogenase (NADP+)